ncbi:MAG: hypothetical protein Cons2KO_06880 [Congregibacter sp.]
MRLLLHIGTEKTGSTALQRYLQANRRQLAEQGVFLPNCLGEGSHRLLSTAFMRDKRQDEVTRRYGLESPTARARWRRGLLEALSKEVEAARAARADLFVISSEHLQPQLRLAELVKALASFLMPMFSSCEVLVYLRRQDEMASSLYSTKLRAGYAPQQRLPLDQVFGNPSRLPDYFDFESLLNRWGRAFGEQSVRTVRYTQACSGPGGIVGDFADRLGVSVPAKTSEESYATANASLSAISQAVLAAFNQRVGTTSDARDASRLQRNALVNYLEREFPGEAPRIPPRQAEAFYSFFRASNTRVAHRWFGEASLFDEVTEMSDAADTQPSAEEVARILTRFESLQDKSGCA